MEGLVWDEKETNAPDISKLPKGKVSTVPQPEYILVKVKDKIVPISLRNDTFKLRGKGKKKINYLNSPCDLLFAVTYHKLQGLTLNKIILSIGKHPTNKLRVDMSSLYVGASRVHNFKELRILPVDNADLNYLTNLKRDPLLRDWIQNYQADGSWNKKGFFEVEKTMIRKCKMNLALVNNVESITKEEAIRFLKDIDLFYNLEDNRAQLCDRLREAWMEGREILEENSKMLLKKYRLHELQNLKNKLKRNEKVGLKHLRSIARKVGIDNSSKLQTKMILTMLDKAAKEYGFTNLMNSNSFSTFKIGKKRYRQEANNISNTGQKRKRRAMKLVIKPQLKKKD